MKLALETFHKFGNVSGLMINIEKTEIIPLCKINVENIRKHKALSKLKINYKAFKTLGIWFSKNETEALRLNFNDKIQAIQKLIYIWTSRNLSWKGKITIIKTLLLPKLYHLLSFIYVPDETLKIINNLIFQFLWSNKPAKIKKESIIAEIDDGGLKIPDIYSIHDSFKISWIIKIFDKENSKWKTLTWKLLNIKPYQFNMNIKDIPDTISSYHKQLLTIWFKHKTIYPIDVKDILNEYILENKFILAANKPLTKQTLNVNIPNKIKLPDILEDNGNILELVNINNKFNINLTTMNYNKIITAIPKEWKSKIQKIQNINIQNLNYNENLNIPNFKINTVLKSISTLKTKDIRKELINRIKKPLTAIDTWIEQYPFLETLEWNTIFRLPYKIVTEPYMQTFQYKIVNRLLNCNQNLFKWKISNSSNCNECINTNDTIEHHLYFCPSTKFFWEKVTHWIEDCIQIKFELTICEVLFGIPFTTDHCLFSINYILLFGKWFINNCKTNEKELNFCEFVNMIKSKLKTLRVVYLNKGKEGEFHNIFKEFIN